MQETREHQNMLFIDVTFTDTDLYVYGDSREGDPAKHSGILFFCMTSLIWVQGCFPWFFSLSVNPIYRFHDCFQSCDRGQIKNHKRTISLWCKFNIVFLFPTSTLDWFLILSILGPFLSYFKGTVNMTFFKPQNQNNSNCAYFWVAVVPVLLL